MCTLRHTILRRPRQSGLWVVRGMAGVPREVGRLENKWADKQHGHRHPYRILIGSDVTFVFHELGQKNGRQTTTCLVDEDARRDTSLAGTDGLDDGGPPPDAGA